jgi:hypothetical protein
MKAMSDKFDGRDWFDVLNESIRNRATWIRGGKCVLLLIALFIVRFALYFATAYQFCHCLVRGRPSPFWQPVGRWMASYLEKATLFMTWTTDRPPFPFAPFSEVMEQEPDYRDEEPAFQPEDESFAEEEERYDPEPPALPPAEDEVADEEPVAEEQAGGEEPEPEDEEGRPSQPPRPDA